MRGRSKWMLLSMLIPFTPGSWIFQSRYPKILKSTGWQERLLLVAVLVVVASRSHDGNAIALLLFFDLLNAVTQAPHHLRCGDT